MSTSYNVYANDHAGGPVDYSTLVANVSALTYSPSALTFPSDTTFAVRATDGTHEESNVDARVRIVLDASGVDITAVPFPVTLITAIPNVGGAIRVDWVHAARLGPTPSGFRVWATVGSTVNYAASPNATATWIPGLNKFSAIVSGLSGGGTAYSVGVRSFNATGADRGTVSTSVTPLATGPSSVESLSGSPTIGDVGPMLT